MTRKHIDPEAAKQYILTSVGYGQPPREHQFQKGKSGNPRGRPRKSQKTAATTSLPGLGDNGAAMRRVLQETVKVREGGKVRHVSKAEALQRVREKKALSGESILAMRDMKKDLLDIDAQEKQVIAEDHAFWRSYLERRAADLQRAKENGTESSQFWMEQEDIIFEPNRSARLRGPVSASQIREFDNLAMLQDAFIVETTFDVFWQSRKSKDNRPSSAAILIGRIDRQLTTKQVAAGKAYWDEIEHKGMVSPRWLKEERDRVWRGLSIKVPPRPFLPRLPDKIWSALQTFKDPLEQKIDEALEKAHRRKR